MMSGHLVEKSSFHLLIILMVDEDDQSLLVDEDDQSLLNVVLSDIAFLR